MVIGLEKSSSSDEPLLLDTQNSIFASSQYCIFLLFACNIIFSGSIANNNISVLVRRCNITSSQWLRGVLYAQSLSFLAARRLGKPHEAVSKLINSGCKLRREINYRENQITEKARARTEGTNQQIVKLD